MYLEGMSKQKVMSLESVLITACLSFLVPELAKTPAKQWTCLSADISLMDTGQRICTSLAKVFYKGWSSFFCSPLSAVPAVC